VKKKKKQVLYENSILVLTILDSTYIIVSYLWHRRIITVEPLTFISRGVFRPYPCQKQLYHWLPHDFMGWLKPIKTVVLCDVWWNANSNINFAKHDFIGRYVTHLFLYIDEIWFIFITWLHVILCSILINHEYPTMHLWMKTKWKI
jgi:hypothetical protein